ncbi:MAG TPA: cyclopropane-fatty-acyl-phospholipid synthase family protein [Vitreimonas sp.]|uniref:cyclopropane-fatty-acyl-phospholipid synthase family protein n=1 Tax=Vitreimonas sp. TaxID=3069702 RepID=UPI002D35734D|nr:cyclopropane-fatty-acyl-phospholipid synthase family protein [Vitreimonas sp.]HYD86758.1 cyclopropane-fatty-acyl-phospholipid synthase family protein [Vitreimonas sp.]
MLDTLLRSFILDGALVVRGPDDRTHAVGGVSEADSPLIVRIHDRATLWRLARNPGLEAGEAYMDGRLTIERGTLYDFLAVATRNLQHIAAQKRRWIVRSAKHGNPKPRARRNVAHHYDLSRELFRLFLDEDLQYSCAYFARPDMSLEEAQAAKKRHLAAKLLLRPGHRVLDIGSGWGGLALTLAREHGAQVLGVTLSTEQLAEARARAERVGLERRARYELRDYREVGGVFDRIVSVGMFEHVGPRDYRKFFEMIAARLAADGVAVLHTIGRTDGPRRGNAWIEKYIFPGGVLPSLSQMAAAIEQAGLILTDVEVLRLHYADTLREWSKRFAAHREEAKRLYDERFCRMWEFYLAGAEAGFREGQLVVFQLQMAKDRAVVPLTRDYITATDHAGVASHRVAAE